MKQYPAYKDSGISWIGEIPINWKIKQLGYLASEEKYSFVDGPFGSDLKNEEYVESGIPLIQLNNIGIGLHYIDNLRFITPTKSEELAKHKAYPDEIVIAKMADPVARASIVSKEYDCYNIVADCVKLKPDSLKANSVFIVYSLNSSYLRCNAELFSGGTTRLRINLSAIKKLRILYPSLSEQFQIATFLDHKTRQIDDLIAKKQKLIEVLKEERTALINHAVTKGIDLAVPMKDSGIEWLGEIPEHWVVKRLKFLVDNIIEKSNSSDFKVALENIESWTGRYLKTENPSELTGEMKSFKQNDILFSKLRPYLAKVYLPVGEGECVGELLVLRSKTMAVPKFLYYRLLSRDFIEVVNSSTYGAKMPRANWEDFIRNLMIPFPNITEQEAIVKKIDHITKTISNALEKLKNEIELISEYKTSLINETVTGKIDVRDYQMTYA